MALTYTLIRRKPEGGIEEIFGPTTLTKAQDHFLRVIRPNVQVSQHDSYIVRPNFTNPRLRNPRDYNNN